MKKYYVNSTYRASDMQQSFKLDNPFATDSVAVYRNGQLMTFGPSNDYVTIPETGKVVFNTPLAENDIVSVISIAEDEKLNLDVVARTTSSKRDSLFKKYGDIDKLEYNNMYTANFAINKTVVKWQFESKRNPFFASVKDIMADIGEFIEGYTPKQVSDFIYNNSVDVIDLIDELAENNITNVEYNKIEGQYISKSKAINNWVKYKTEIDLIYARYFGISYNYGSIRKTIGDISIERSTKLPYIDNLLKRLLEMFDEADMQIRGVNTVAAFVKAGDKYKYDNWERKTLFNE